MRDIDFSYGSVQILFGVDLTVHDGEMLALLGTNGAGKSTLLRVLTGLEAPQSGTITFDGDDVAGLHVTEVVRRGIVMVPGGKAVFSDMTVDENLDAGSYLLRREPGLAKQRKQQVLEMFPSVANRLNEPAGTMSGGEQQQLALAKAFLLDPRVLCIDELSLGLAPVIVEKLIGAVRTLNEAGTTIVLVEQSLNVAATLCDRAVFLEKGAVRFEGATRELLERSDIARAVFLGTADRDAPGDEGDDEDTPDRAVLAAALQGGLSAPSDGNA